jgi:hypothetical protein
MLDCIFERENNANSKSNTTGYSVNAYFVEGFSAISQIVIVFSSTL